MDILSLTVFRLKLLALPKTLVIGLSEGEKLWNLKDLIMQCVRLNVLINILVLKYEFES